MKNLRWNHAADTNRKTFEEVVTLHLDPLYRTALRLTGGHTANAEDLVQDCLLRACEGYGELRHHDAARTWLYTILLRTHFNRQRTEKRHPEALACDLNNAEFEQALESWPTDGLGTSAGGKWPSPQEICDAIDSLDESLRSVVVLVDVEGFRQREVATMLRLPEGTVASRLFRARRIVRNSFADMTGDARGRDRRSHGRP